jgi:enhancer of mRNA-decapping protein 4
VSICPCPSTFSNVSSVLSDTLKLEQYLAQYRAANDRTTEIVDLIRSTPSKISSEIESSVKRCTSETVAEVNRDYKLLQANIVRTVREHIKQEIEKGFESQASSLEDSVLSVVRSQAQTPAPSNIDIHEQIRTLLAQGQANKAFHKALLSNDLSLVEYTLEKADYKSVFNPCSLEQTVLLSLIQQIGASMWKIENVAGDSSRVVQQTHTELKNK